ncbi:hypothetical protein MSAN_02270400 [Mycena sanguinolenta]|uniref:Uncharacterized protein n=1 Tax=Mycena sanguinolenta TaxID=230812 RepID=A0A8H7CJ07_9AGAR|nr:hypothetical protein MSAN_02270400 [Mycena sanguinolenta]
MKRKNQCSARNSHLSLACHEILVCPRSLRIGLNHPCCNQRSLHLWARRVHLNQQLPGAAAASAPLASAHTTPMTSSAAQSRRVGPPLVGTDSVSLPTPAPDTITIPRMSRKLGSGCVTQVYARVLPISSAVWRVQGMMKRTEVN